VVQVEDLREAEPREVLADYARSGAISPATDARKVNVMLLTTGLGIGGAEVVVRDLARTLDRQRFNVSICCLKALGPIGTELAEEGIDISVLPGVNPARANYFTSIQLRRAIRRKRIDIVHSHTTYALVDACLCRCVSPGLRVAHTFHFGNYPHAGPRIRWMEQIFSRLADRLIAVGQVQKEQIRSAYGLSDRSIGVVRNGVQLPQAGVGDPGFRARIGAEGKVLVGTIATLIPQKGLPNLMAVARRVRDVVDNVHFVVVGEGKMRDELERLRRELRLEDTVTLTGWLTNAASLALPSFDIYFQPSLWEAMSISILEAMGAGKPVVATLVGEASHLIARGAEGLLYEPRDIEGMATAVSRLAADESLRREIGMAAARKVAGHFTVGHMTQAYEEVYLDVVQGHRGLASHAPA
jgi:glycosyltransferase involved in cell wall biosynthesis